MSKIKQRIRHKIHGELGANVFKDEQGAIDLSSIMVGIIVIGLIGGVIAATVFSIIPWSQDNAAKQQLDSIAAAESAYMGLSSSTPPAVPAGASANSYANSTELKAANLLNTGPSYCVESNANGKGYDSYAQSSSGKIWSSSDKNTQPVIFTGILPTDCKFITESYSGPYIDTTPKLTSLTFVCDTTSTGTFPINTNLNGTEEWSDGTTNTYTNGSTPVSKTLTAGVTYTAKFTGTYRNFSTWGTLGKCLTTVNHWGAETGVTNADSGFFQATKLTDVPAHIPTTITSMNGMFNQAANFNDPDISKWDTSNVTNMANMFNMTNAFNQPIENWNTSKVTKMNGMFAETKAFNQSLNGWNTSNVTDMGAMFLNAKAFNQPIDKWNTSKITSFWQMFQGATVFNQSLNSWNTSNSNSMYAMFSGASSFNQPLNNWDTSNVTNMAWMFSRTAFNQNINNWNTSKVTNMYQMFAYTTTFNQTLNSWDTTNVTTMSSMFAGSKFDQPLNNWKTGNVTDMSRMFQDGVFSQNIASWDTSKVTTMESMFEYNTKFAQNISGWNVSSLTNGVRFAPASSLPVGYNPAGTQRY